MNKSRIKFVRRLRIACIHKDIKRADLAEKSGIKIDRLNQIFQGKSVSHDTMENLRECTGFSEGDFVKLTDAWEHIKDGSE